MNSEEFDAFVAKQNEQAQREIELLSRYLGKDPRSGDMKAEAEKVRSCLSHMTCFKSLG
jgi:fatty acid synthase subunit beta